MKPWQHFKTITHHRFLVMINCFRIGLIRQGLTHDLSKYLSLIHIFLRSLCHSRPAADG